MTEKTAKRRAARVQHPPVPTTHVPGGYVSDGETVKPADAKAAKALGITDESSQVVAAADDTHAEEQNLGGATGRTTARRRAGSDQE